MGSRPCRFESEMPDAFPLEPAPCANAEGPSASRRGLAFRAKSILSALVAMGIMGLTTGCQSESSSASASPTQSTSTSQIQTTSPSQSLSSPPSSASQIQSQSLSQSHTPSPTQSQSQSPSPIQSPIQSLIPSPSPSATAPPILTPANGLALAVRVNPDAAQSITSSETSDPRVDLTLPINPSPDVVAGAPATQAAPGPLPIFGAAAAFGASRQMRKRIKGSTTFTHPHR